jgi:hypothetical protein
MYDGGEMSALRPRFSHVWSAHQARSAVWLALLLVVPGGAQQSIPHGPFTQPIQQGVPGSINDIHGADMSDDQEVRLRIINKERQKSLVSDTNKLLKLANELDAEVKTANSTALTPQQLHKLAEIEKLAHNVKDKMTYSVRGPTIYQAYPYPVH